MTTVEIILLAAAEIANTNRWEHSGDPVLNAMDGRRVDIAGSIAPKPQLAVTPGP